MVHLQTRLYNCAICNRGSGLLELWENRDKYVVGIQGTSEWYVFRDLKSAMKKYNELKTLFS